MGRQKYMNTNEKKKTLLLSDGKAAEKWENINENISKTKRRRIKTPSEYHKKTRQEKKS